MKTKSGRHSILVAVLVLSWVGAISACHSAPPVVLKFSSSPTQIDVGESSTLSWIVKDATNVSIDHGIGVVANVGNREVSPSTTTTYTLIASNSGGAVAASVAVVVEAVLPPSPDTTPPVVTSVSASSVTETSAVIAWTTDEPATSQVEYGATSDYGSTTTLDEQLVISHSMTLGGLELDTTYHFRVKSRDASGNEAASDTDQMFTTLAEADITPPAISEVSASNITDVSATINWETDEPATSQVEYGTTNAYGPTTPVNEELTTSHSVTLGSLESGTTYLYRVWSEDAAGNDAVSGDYTFATSKSATEIGTTEVGDILILRSDTTWTEEESPYIITSYIQIASGVSLLIEPGVTVQFQERPAGSQLSIGVLGILAAQGTPDKKIVFTSSGSDGYWEINMGGEDSVIEYCVMEGGEININGSSILIRDSVLTEHCVLRISGDAQIIDNQIVQDSEITVSGSGTAYFSGNEISAEGFWIIGGSSTITKNDLTFTNYGFLIEPHTSPARPDATTVTITYNNIAGCQSESAIRVGEPMACNLTVEHNNIYSNEGFSVVLARSPNESFDFPNNWWGTTDASAIDSSIWDYNDNLGLRPTNIVNYQPIATSQIADAGVQ